MHTYILFVCLGLTSFFNIWGHITTVPACSSGTLTNVLPHRHAMPQTQDMTPHSIQTRGLPVAVLSIIDVERHAGIHSYPFLMSWWDPTGKSFHDLPHTPANAQRDAVMVVISRKLGRKYRTIRVLNAGPVVCESITLSAHPQRLLHSYIHAYIHKHTRWVGDIFTFIRWKHCFAKGFIAYSREIICLRKICRNTITPTHLIYAICPSRSWALSLLIANNPLIYYVCVYIFSHFSIHRDNGLRDRENERTRWHRQFTLFVRIVCAGHDISHTGWHHSLLRSIRTMITRYHSKPLTLCQETDTVFNDQPTTAYRTDLERV